MAVNGFTTIGVSNAADNLLNQLHDIEGGQKRELLSALLTGLLVSEPGIIVSILNAGKMANSAFNSGVDPVLGAGVTFPAGHFMEGFSATNTIDKMVLAVETYNQALAAQSEVPTTEGESKGKKDKK